MSSGIVCFFMGLREKGLKKDKENVHPDCFLFTGSFSLSFLL